MKATYEGYTDVDSNAKVRVAVNNPYFDHKLIEISRDTPIETLDALSFGDSLEISIRNDKAVIENA